MALLWLPAAERDPKGRALTFTTTRDPKGVLHTTETTTWPGYQGGAVTPHLTVLPIPGKGVRVRQHVPFSRSGFALRNLPGGIETNRDLAYQVELIGTCEKGGKVHKAGAYLWPDADDRVLLDLYDKVIGPMSSGLGIPLRALEFQAYPSSYGSRRPAGRTNTVRLSPHACDTYSGWMGHQHVDENLHGDPGAFPWARMMAAVKRRDAAQQPPPAKPPAKPAPAPGGKTLRAPAFPLRAGYYFGPMRPLRNYRSVSGYFSHGRDLKRWQQRMQDRGWKLGATGRWDLRTERVVRQFQREKGVKVTGRIERETWRLAWEAPITK